MKKNTREERRKQAHEFFHRRWDEITLVIDYNTDWETIYKEKEILDQAKSLGWIEYSIAPMLYDEQIMALRPGQVAKSMDDYGRKFIIVMTRLGAWVFFVVSKDVQRGMLGDLRERRLKQYQLNEITYLRSELALYLGSPNGLYDGNGTIARNIGERMELVYEMMKDPTVPPFDNFYYIRRHKDKT